eukprot:c25392_g10_i1 orf=2-202(-)
MLCMSNCPTENALTPSAHIVRPTTAWRLPCFIFHSHGFNIFCILLHASSCINISHKDIRSRISFINL